MAQRRTVSGRRSVMAWLAIVLVLVLAIVLAAFVFVIVPQQQLRQQVQATAEARQAEVERLYAAGVAFQDVGDWEAAEAEFKQVVTFDPAYKDVRTRLAEVKARLAESEATATAEAAAQAARARADYQATATTQAQATATAQTLAATATMNAVEARYQKALAYINLEKWVEAQVELQAVFEVDPNYKDVQAQWAVVNSEIAKLTPTVTPTPPAPPTPEITPTPTATAEPPIGTGWEQALAEAKFVAYVRTGAKVYTDTLEKYGDLNAYKVGEFVVWDRSPGDYSDKGRWSLFPETVGLKFAINDRGDFFAAAMGALPDVLAFLSDGGIATPATWGYPLKADQQLSHPWLQLDAKANALAEAVQYEFLMLARKGYKSGGPERICSAYGCDDGEIATGFDTLTFGLKNNLDRQVIIVESVLCNWQGETVWANHLPFRGIRFKDGPFWPMWLVLQRQWLPKKTTDTDGPMMRRFRLTYDSPKEAYVLVTATGDVGDSGWVKVNGEQVVSLRDCCWEPYQTWQSTRLLPENVEMQLNTTWSGTVALFRMAVIADDVEVSEVAESPTGGMDKNPAPLIWIVQPGWNGFAPQ